MNTNLGARVLSCGIKTSFSCNKCSLVFERDCSKPVKIGSSVSYLSYPKTVTQQGQDKNVSTFRRFLTNDLAGSRLGLGFRDYSTTNTPKIDPNKNYYQILGVTHSCSDQKIKQSYYRLSKVFHPDISENKAAVDKFHEITEAYEILINPTLRHRYDASRRGHFHGVHRGTFKPHRVNMDAKGPHQVRQTDKEIFDDWYKDHYSKMLRKKTGDGEDFEMARQHVDEWLYKEKLREKHRLTKAQSVALLLLYLSVGGFLYVICSALFGILGMIKDE